MLDKATWLKYSDVSQQKEHTMNDQELAAALRSRFPPIEDRYTWHLEDLGRAIAAFLEDNPEPWVPEVGDTVYHGVSDEPWTVVAPSMNANFDWIIEREQGLVRVRVCTNELRRTP